MHVVADGRRCHGTGLRGGAPRRDPAATHTTDLAAVREGDKSRENRGRIIAQPASAKAPEQLAIRGAPREQLNELRDCVLKHRSPDP